MFSRLGGDSCRGYQIILVWFAYVLKSINFDYYYKGHCQHLEIRLQQHIGIDQPGISFKK